MPRRPLNEILISAVLPVYNEVGVLPQLFQRVSAAIGRTGAGQEIIFVNDGSHDGSGEVLDKLAAENPRVRVLHLSRNFGHQAAVQAGLAHCQGDLVLLMDSDMQDAPEALERFVAEWQDGFDVVYAVRRHRPERIWKRWLFAGFHRTLAAVANTPIPIDAGNFSLMDGRVVREIVQLAERDRYLPGLRSWVGFKQKGVEVRRDERYDGKPRVSMLGLWRLAKTAIFSFSTFPLVGFSFIGYSALAVFVALGVFSLFCRVFTDLAVPGWTSHVLVASFFGAVNALGISMLGEYVARIYDQVRGRPMYLLDRGVNVGQGASVSSSPRAMAAAGDTRLYEQVLQDSEEMLQLTRQADQNSYSATDPDSMRCESPAADSRKPGRGGKKLAKRARKARGRQAP